MNAGLAVDREIQANGRFAWLALVFAAWIIGGLIFIVWALSHGLTDDVGLSPYHTPFFAGILALAALSLVLVRRAIGAGRRWTQAFPPGYGSLGAGLLLLLAWPIVDIGWREGIGVPDEGLETTLAPSRLLLVFGAILVAIGPLRAALRHPSPRPSGWPAVLSAGFAYVVLAGVGGFQPAQNPRLETARFEPQASSEVWVMDADGRHQTRLVEAADGWEPGLPAWSPDGSQITYAKARAPELMFTPADDMDIWLASADGTNQRLLVGGSGWQWLPKWSPDGQWITYTVDGPGGPGVGAGLRAPFFGFGQGPAFGQPPSVAPAVDVWRIRADGSGSPERLTNDPADDRAGTYSPDGQHLLFDSTRDEGRTAVYVSDADGSHAVRVTFMGNDWGATWSPDGSRIAFHANPDGGAEDIYVVTYPGGALTRLTTSEDSETRPSWSPDGTRIAFSSVVDGELELWSIAADGSDPRNLTRSPGVLDYFSPGGGAWGPDGRIVYERSQEGPARSDPLVRDNLGVAGMLLEVMLLAVVVLVVLRTRPPFGAIMVIMAMGASFAALDGEDWRFLPAAIVGGLLADVLVRLASPKRKAQVAGAASAAAYVLGAGVAVIVTTGLGWTPSLLLGVAIASAAIGWGLAAIIAPSPVADAGAPGD